MSSPNGPVPYAAAQDIDLRRVGGALKRKSASILGFTLLVFVLAYIGVNVVTPRYTGEARILLENRDNYYTRPDPTDRNNSSIDPEAVQSQVLVITSRDLARVAIKKMNLVGNPEFDPAVTGLSVYKRALVLLGILPNPAEQAPEDRVLEAYYNHLTVYPVGKSRVVAIEFTSKDPKLSASMANTIAGLYIQMQEAAKKDTAKSAASWLASTIDPLRKRVNEAESKVEEFRAAHGLLLGSNNTTLSSQQLSELSTQLATARSQQADAQAKAKLIRDLLRDGRIFEIPDVANNELIRRLIEQRITLRGQLAFASRTLLPAHPRIKELQAQLADLDSQIRAAAQRTVKSLEAEASVAGSRVASLTQTLSAQEKVTSSANANEVQLRALERDAKILREQLESYLTKYREAAARDTEQAQSADALIVSRAIVPSLPSFPKKAPMVILATLAALVLGVSLVVVKELLAASADRPGAVPPPPSAPEDRDGLRRDRSASPKLRWPLKAAGMKLRPSAAPAGLSAEDAARFNAPAPGQPAEAHAAVPDEGRHTIIASDGDDPELLPISTQPRSHRSRHPVPSQAQSQPSLAPDGLEQRQDGTDASLEAMQSRIAAFVGKSSASVVEPRVEIEAAPLRPSLPDQSEMHAPLGQRDVQAGVQAQPQPQAAMAKPAAPRTAQVSTSAAPRVPEPQGDLTQAALARLAEQMMPPHADGHGRSLLVTQPGQGGSALKFARAFGRFLARKERVIMVSLDDDAIADDRLGFTDLVQENASFIDVIERESGSRMHVMAPGSAVAEVNLSGPGFETALSALDQMYDWVIFFAPYLASAHVREIAGRLDGAVLATAGQGDDIQQAHNSLRAAGAKSLIVTTPAFDQVTLAA